MSRILMVTAEATPFAKAGGLADVLGTSPAALVGRGEEVGVVRPRYSSARISSSQRIWNEMPLAVGPHAFVVAIDQERMRPHCERHFVPDALGRNAARSGAACGI